MVGRGWSRSAFILVAAYSEEKVNSLMRSGSKSAGEGTGVAGYRGVYPQPAAAQAVSSSRAVTASHVAGPLGSAGSSVTCSVLDQTRSAPVSGNSASENKANPYYTKAEQGYVLTVSTACRSPAISFQLVGGAKTGSKGGAPRGCISAVQRMLAVPATSIPPHIWTGRWCVLSKSTDGVACTADDLVRLRWLCTR